MEERKTSGIPIVGFLVVEKTADEDGYIAPWIVTDNRGLVQASASGIFAARAIMKRTRAVSNIGSINVDSLALGPTSFF